MERASPSVQWPDQGYSAVPYEIYSDQATFEEEQDKIFRGPIWHFIGLEVEVPNVGDYKCSHVGITPVVFIRDADGINAVVNRCAHRGNLVCYKDQGNTKEFVCVYHNWTYDKKGNFVSAAFAKGVGGKGGLPKDFDPSKHGLQRLRVETLHGMVFCTFHSATPPLEAWLGEAMLQNVKRVLGRPLKILGTYTQGLRGNWKLYMENVRDSYHASLLHFMMATFNYNRQTATGGITFSDDALHHISWSADATDTDKNAVYSSSLRAVRSGFQLKDPSIMDYFPEYPCGTTAAIQSIFPSCIVQQIRNVIGCRLIVPKTVDSCDLYWWLLGTHEDTPEQEAIRIKQSNLVGPAGLVSMEDGVVIGWVQRATRGDGKELSTLQMGGREIGAGDNNRVTEVSVRSFWRGYRQLMGQ